MRHTRIILLLLAFGLILLYSCGGNSDKDSANGNTSKDDNSDLYHFNDTTSKPSREYSDTCKIENDIYTYVINRSGCDTLSVVQGTDERIYHDNSIDLKIYKGNYKKGASPIIEKHFTKNGFKSYENKYSNKKVTDLALIDFDYNQRKLDDHSCFNFVIYFGNISGTGFGDEDGEILYGIRINLDGDMQITSLKPDVFKDGSMPETSNENEDNP